MESYITVQSTSGKKILLTGGEAIYTLLKKINLEETCDL
jgi:hypothetical protein